eukprot:scaffold53559_cov66-Phaeocystis_antarctica.AAC.1
MQARLRATGKGAPPSSAAGDATAALAASLSAFRSASALRTSLVAAPRSGCCACSLASSGLKPRSGSATRSPRTASSRASGVQGSLMRGFPKAFKRPPPFAGARGLSDRRAPPVSLAKIEEGGRRPTICLHRYALGATASTATQPAQPPPPSRTLPPHGSGGVGLHGQVAAYTLYNLCNTPLVAARAAAVHAHEEEERARRTRPEQREEGTHAVDGGLRQPTRDQGRGDQAWLGLGLGLGLGLATRGEVTRPRCRRRHRLRPSGPPEAPLGARSCRDQA